MTDTHEPILSPENPDAYRISVRQEYNLLADQLGLPTFATLPGLSAADIEAGISKIVDTMAGVRGSIFTILEKKSALAKLKSKFEQEIRVSPINSFEFIGDAEKLAFARADALLKIVYENFRNEDIQTLLTTMSTAIADPRVQLILDSNIDDRQKVLALSTIQKHGTALDILNSSATKEKHARHELKENQHLMRIASNVQQIGSLELPAYNETETKVGIAAMRVVMDNALAAFGLNNGDLINLYDRLTSDQQDIARDANVPQGFPRVDLPAQSATTDPISLVTTPAQSERTNNQRLDNIIELAKKQMAEYDAARKKSSQTIKVLEEMGRNLQDQHIAHAALGNTDYPNIHRVFQMSGTAPYDVQRDNITSGKVNLAQLMYEYKRALHEANPAHSVDLQPEEHYKEHIDHAKKELNEILHSKKDAGPVTAETIWSIVRHGLLKEGVRGPVQDSTLAYMQARLDLTPEKTFQIEEMKRQSFPDLHIEGGEATKQRVEEQKVWAEANGLSFSEESKKRYEVYMNRLFSKGFVGVGLTERNFGRHSFPELINAYFATRYIYNLPQNHKLRIHNSSVTQLLGNLHDAIIRRFNVNYSQAPQQVGMSPKEMEVALGEDAAAKIESVPAAVRLEAFNAYLNSDAYYSNTRRGEIETIAIRALRPIQEETDKRKKKQEAWSNKRKIATDVVTYIPSKTLGFLKNTSKAAWNKRKTIAWYTTLGAAAGSFIPIFGTAIGAAAGATIAAFSSSESHSGHGH